MTAQASQGGDAGAIREARRKWTRYAVVALVVVWAALYLPHLANSPSWYGDETLALDIAQNLRQGEFAVAALRNTFLTIVYQPVYEWYIAIFQVPGLSSLHSARLANALLALGTSMVLLLGGRRLIGLTPSAFAAVLFLSAPQVILHFRMVFPHNGVAFGAVLALLAVCRRSKWKTDALVGLGNLFAVGSHPLGVVSAACSGLVRWRRPVSWLLVGVLPALILLIFYVPVLWHHGEDLLVDAGQILSSYGKYSEQHSAGLAENLWRFFSMDFYHTAGALGMLLAPLHPRWRRCWPLTLYFLIISLALFSNRSNLTVFYYQAILLSPFLALGLVSVFLWVVHFAHRLARQLFSPIHRLSRTIPLVIGSLLTLAAIPPVWSGKLAAKNDFWATQSEAEVEAVAEWIQGHSSPHHLVIANSNLGWLLDRPYANLLQWTAWHGHQTFMHEFGTPRERFRYDLSPDNIRFVTLGDIDTRWALGEPHVMDTLTNAGVHKWPVVWKGKFYVVLANPEFAHD